jgi:hypothetical protein
VMSHRRCPDHYDVTSPWLAQPLKTHICSIS